MNTLRCTAPLLACLALLLGCDDGGAERSPTTQRDEAGVDEQAPDARMAEAPADAGPPKGPKPQDASTTLREDAASARDAAANAVDADAPSVADASVEPTLDAGPSEPREGGPGDGASATQDAGQDAGPEMFPPRGTPGRCTLPSSCRTVNTIAFELRACCLSESVCGYDLVRPAELSEAFFGPLADGSPIAKGTCVPADRVFRAAPGESEERVAVEGGPDILVTPSCDSRILGGFSLPGCCMPNNQCGVSTHNTADTLGVLVVGLSPPGFTRIQCMPVDTLNMQFRQTNLAGFGQLPVSNQSCDFKAVDAMLPPNP